MAGPLERIRVLDLSQGDAGPFCSMQLGDAGADVIKVEPPQGDWARGLGPPFCGDDSAFFLALNRNKRSVAIDLKKGQGKEITLKLAKRSDVFLESFRPGVAERLGLGYEALSRVNPQIIYCSLSAFGQTGPYRDKPATDLVLQGAAGVMRYMGRAGQSPVKIGTNVVAVAAGIFACQAIVAALLCRQRTGVGQKIDVSGLQAMLMVQGYTMASQSEPDAWTGYAAVEAYPPSVGFQTKDGDIDITFPSYFPGYPAEERWVEFCRRIGLERLGEDPRFSDAFARAQNYDSLRQVLEAKLASMTSEEVMAILEELGAMTGPLYTYDQLFSHPQVHLNQMVVEMSHVRAGRIRTTGIPWKLQETPGQIRRPPPALGQHTEEVLQQLGYTAPEIAGFKKARVI